MTSPPAAHDATEHESHGDCVIEVPDYCVGETCALG